MSDETIIKNEEEKPKSVVEHSQTSSTTPTVAPKPRGGFMNGGALTTALFLIAFFLVSYSLGYTTSQYNKLATAGSPNGATQQAGTGTAQAGQQQATGLQDGQTVTKGFTIDDRRIKGDKNAKVTIVEFSDFECPFCGKFYNETYNKIVDKYVKTGKVKIAFKDFPLSFHPQAQKAAEASRCALEQNKFWEMHDKLFANQTTLSVDNYKKWAGELGLKTDQFNSCLDNGKYAEDVKKDQSEGLAIGVQGTPSFLINGEALVGAYPYEQFEKVIEAKLK